MRQELSSLKPTARPSARFAVKTAASACVRAIGFMIVLLFTFVLLESHAHADSNDRNKRLRGADLEWDEIEGAARYEIEIVSLTNKSAKPIYFKSKTAAWTGRLLPGKYSLRLRTYDSRDVPSEWGEASEFWVKIPPPTKRKPEANATITSQSSDSQEQEFSWEPVIGAERYRLEVYDPTGKAIATETIANVQTTLKLPVAQRFTWKVTGLMTEDQEGEGDESPFAFVIKGRKLDPPRISRPANEFVQELEWDSVEKAEVYNLVLERKDERGAWKVVEKASKQQNPRLAFKDIHPGGDYRLRVQALAELRPPSAVETLEFKAREGDRSPAAAEMAALRESLDKPSSFYAITSYLVTNVAYEGVLREQASAVKFDALGATGRLGLGYLFPGGAWSTFTIADVSGFDIRGETHSFLSAETHALRRFTWNASLLRVGGGVYYKEIPEASRSTVSKIAAGGPHVGFEFLHPFNYRLGLQANARAYYSVLGVSTPNGQELEPALSLQFSLLGSYRITPSVVGSAGYSYRADEVRYKAVPGNPNDPASGAAGPGDVNSVKITGHYLNLILEWAF